MISLPEPMLAVPPAVLVLIVAALALILPRKVGYGLSAIALAAVVPWSFGIEDGVHTEAILFGFDLAVVAGDPASRLMGVIFGLFGLTAVGYAYSTDADRAHLAFGLGYVGTSLGAVFAGDWLTLLLFWEGMTVMSTVLVWLYGGQAVRAGYRYALAHGIGGSLLLAGIAVHAVDGGLTSQVLWFDGSGLSSGIAAILGGIGIGVNAAFIGVHYWLPDTYSRPHVAASVFMTAFTTKTAVYAAFRAFPEGNLYLAFMGAAMTVFGATFALMQKDMRRLLAYHIQAQVGYMMAGIGIGGALGVAGGFAHLFNHILYKGVLFMAAGILIIRTGQNRLDKFGAVGTTAPVTLGAFLIGALAITGVPGFNGFVSKGMILDAADAADMHFALTVLLWLGVIGTFASFIKFGYYAFMKGEREPIRDVSPVNVGSMGILAGLCVLLGLWYQPLIDILPMADQLPELKPYSTGHLIEGIGLGIAGLIAFVVGKPLIDRAHGGIDINTVHDPGIFYGSRSIVDALSGIYQWFDTVLSPGFWQSQASAQRGMRAIDERVVDGVVDGVAGASIVSGARMRRIQTGSLADYLNMIVLSLVILVVAYGVNGGWLL